MYEFFAGLTCIVPFCAHLVGTLLYKKFTEIQSPTYFYDKEINYKFYEPLLEDELIQP